MKPEKFELLPENYPFTIELATRFGDVDALRHVNNVAITQLFEEARVRFGMFSKGKAFSGLVGLERQVTASVLVNYLGEVFYPDPVTVAIGVCHIGRTSHSLGAIMLQQQIPVAHSRATMVKSEDGQSSPLLPESIDRLKKFLIKGNPGAR